MVGVGVEVRVHLRLEDVFERTQFRLFLCLEVLRLVQDLAITVAQDVGREPALQAKHPRLQHGSDHRLDQGLPCLEVLAADRHTVVGGQLLHGRDVHRKAGAAVDEGDALLNGGIGIHHGRGYALIVLLERPHEPFDLLVYLRWRNEFFGRSCIDHHQPIALVLRLELLDVVANGVDHVQLGFCLFHIRAVDALDVIVIEDSRHWFYGLQEVCNGLNVIAGVQDTALERCLVGVVGNRVPRAEDNLVQAYQRHEISDQGHILLCSLAHAYGGHLGDRPDGFAHAATDVLHAGDEG